MVTGCQLLVLSVSCLSLSVSAAHSPAAVTTDNKDHDNDDSNINTNDEDHLLHKQVVFFNRIMFPVFPFVKKSIEINGRTKLFLECLVNFTAWFVRKISKI